MRKTSLRSLAFGTLLAVIATVASPIAWTFLPDQMQVLSLKVLPRDLRQYIVDQTLNSPIDYEMLDTLAAAVPRDPDFLEDYRAVVPLIATESSTEADWPEGSLEGRDAIWSLIYSRNPEQIEYALNYYSNDRLWLRRICQYMQRRHDDAFEGPWRRHCAHR